MFLLNDQPYKVEQLQRIIDNIANKLHTLEKGNAIALCIKKPLRQLAYNLFCKSSDYSILLLPGDTPNETAIEQAEQSGCRYLIYGEEEKLCSTTNQSNIDFPSLMQYSSGTTGKPKLILRPWEKVEEEIDAYNQALNASSDETPIILVPITHSFGLITGVLASLERGHIPHIISTGNPKYMLHIISKCERPIIYGVPHLFEILLNLSKGEIKFHKIITSGSPLPYPLFKRLKNVTECIMQQYGNTEVGCISLSTNISAPNEVGVPLRHIKAELLPDGSKNEIVVKTGKEVIYTNDAGCWDENDNLQVLGRLDDMINIGGKKVFPYEVEQAIQKLNVVKEVVVYQVNHNVTGEKVKAMVVAKGPLTPDVVKDWCMRFLPRYKVPAEIEVVDQIPKGNMGKISRRLLQERERTFT